MRPVSIRRLLLITILFIVTQLLIAQLDRQTTYALLQKYNGSAEEIPAAIDEANNQVVANCRHGASTSPSDAHVLSRIGAGVFYDWHLDWPHPMPANDAEFLHLIRARQRKSDTGEYLPDWYSSVPLDENLADIIRNDRGAVWMIGNEPERGPNEGETFSPRTDDIHADQYAEAYHDIYHFIKGIDPTARIANAGLIQITPMRLQYLDMVWDAYQRKYGASMPVDIWTIHAYVLPELTPAGEPNNIASAALGTDLALGKRASGYDSSKCANSDVYCFAEHDDPSIIEEQVVSMRQWMKERGQQDKPLVVTEFSTLYPYIVKEDGACDGLHDEYGKCFTPERVSKFMDDAFGYFNNATDPELGLPSDNFRLVQQWIWYAVYAWDIGSSNLLQEDKQTLTLMGETFKNQVSSEPVIVNLIVDNVSGTTVSIDENGMATAQLSVSFLNNGNVAIKDPFEITFYQDAALTQPIDSITFSSNIRGCATERHAVELNWKGLASGAHPFWVVLDNDRLIREADETDNIGSGQVTVSDPEYQLEVQIISDGDGTGGTVSIAPNGPTYPSGTEVRLTAVPYSGWTFTGWKGGIVSNLPEIVFSIDRDIGVEAYFAQDQYQLDVSLAGEGEVIISPKQDYYQYGERVTLDAIPAPGWRFSRWHGEAIGDGPSVELSFDKDIYVTAEFVQFSLTDSNMVFTPLIFSKAPRK